MTSLLSALSGGFSKSLLLSTLLPVVVFVLLALVLVLPHVPGTVAFVQWAQGLDLESKLGLVTPAVVLLTAVLYHLNKPILRVYEGYPWSDSWMGRWRTRVHRRAMHEAKTQWMGLWTLLLTPETKMHPDESKVADHWNDLARTLNSLYPAEPDAVLPTRLGNVIGSFESYPWRQYRMRAITLWPRLSALLDNSQTELMDDAKTSLDFSLNSSLLCGVLAVLIAVVHLVFPAGLATAGVLAPLAVELAIFGGLSYFFYLAAIPQAAAWGMTFKGAFDLYRGKLLESLGYRFRPESLEEEQALWELISQRMILSDLTIDPLPAYERPKTLPTRVRTKPDDLKVTLLRGTSRPSPDSLEVTIQVRNLDPTQVADGVVVIDTLPEAWAYEWASAASSTGAVEVTGINPYRFKIASLAAGAEARITYRAVSAAFRTRPE